MAFDEAPADRVRELLGDRPGVSEKRMFGRLAFLTSGHMAVAASREGGPLVRCDPAESDELVAATPARVAVMFAESVPPGRQG